MAQIRIRVGAQLDPGATAVFAPLLVAAAQARAKLAAEGKSAGDAFVGGYRSSARAAEASDKIVIASAERASKARRALVADETREIERSLKKQQDAAKAVISGAARTFGGVARAGVGVAGSVARGAGVNLDVGASVGRSVALESRVTDILNQVRLGGGQVGKSEHGELTKLSRDVGNKYAVGTNDVADVLGAFQAKSSDLGTGKEALGSLAELAQATGTKFDDMGNAAGEVNSQLEGMPDRANVLLGIMRHITAQTAAGKVEMSDYSKYIGRIASAANAFSGDYAKNIGELGALSQISMKGGRVTAAEATGSAQAISRDLSKPRTIKAWDREFGAGKGAEALYVDKGHTKFKSPTELMMLAVEKTKGDQTKLAQLLPNVVSKASAIALSSIYTNAGGGKAGRSAMEAEIGKYSGTVTGDEVKGLATEKMATTAAKVQLFNNELDRVVAESSSRLLPALEHLAPSAIEGAEALGKLAGFAAENPGAAITLAITASIAKAAIGETVGKALSGALSSALAKQGAFNILGAATIGVAAGTIILSHLNAERAEGRAEVRGQIGVNEEVLGKAEKEKKDTGTLSPAAEAALREEKARIQTELAKANAPTISNLDVLNPFAKGKTAAAQGEQREARDKAGTLYNEVKGIDALLAGATGHKEAAADLKSAAVSLKAVAAALNGGKTLPGPGPGSTTGPAPVR